MKEPKKEGASRFDLTKARQAHTEAGALLAEIDAVSVEEVRTTLEGLDEPLGGDLAKAYALYSRTVDAHNQLAERLKEGVRPRDVKGLEEELANLRRKVNRLGPILGEAMSGAYSALRDGVAGHSFTIGKGGVVYVPPKDEEDEGDVPRSMADFFRRLTGGDVQIVKIGGGPPPFGRN